MSSKLILFDVDGILLKEGAITVTVDYWKVVVKKYFDLDVSKDDIYRSGKTDRQILFELLKNKGLKIKPNDKRLDSALNNMGLIVKQTLGNKKLNQISNVEKLIKRLKYEKVTIGLLTGNAFGKAKVKLQSAGLWKYFKIGAFGDYTIHRSVLVPVAIKDAKEKTKISFQKKNVFLIGDTIRDIQCAKEGGVKIISVATGKETITQLTKEKPDYLFKDFSNQNINKIIKILKNKI